MRCHDFHLSGYDVAKFGSELVLHLDWPGDSRDQSHIRFSDVALYHFVHTGGTIIFGIDEVPIDLAWMLESFIDRALRDLVEHHAKRGLRRSLRNDLLREVLANCFAFAIRVGGEIDRFGFFGGLL